MKFPLLFVASLTAFYSVHASAQEHPMPLACIGLAAQEYGLPPKLLHALMLTEGGRMGVAIRQKNGSADIGPFQINSQWLSKLSPYGIDIARLAWDPAVNARAAAWRLRSEIILAGGDVWKGVGHYRSHTPRYRDEQIVRVIKNYRRLPDLNYKGSC